MKRDQFTFYRSYYEAIRLLPARDQTAVLLAICAYALDEEEPELSGVPLAVFALIRPTLDTGRKKAANRQNKPGASPKQSASGEEPSPEQTGNKPKTNAGQTRKESEEEGEREKESEVECEKEHECVEGAKPPNPPPAASRRFVPPSVDEVAAYCRERGNAIDAQSFVSFYAAKGWRVGNQPMRDWKAAVITWERRNAQTPRAMPGQTPRPADAMQRHSYTQEDYSRMVIDLDAEEGGT